MPDELYLKSDVNYSEPKAHDTALILCIRNTFMEGIQRLCKIEALNVNHANKANDYPLMLGIMKDHKIVELLIQTGRCNIDIKVGPEEMTPLMYCIKFNKKATALYLITKQANINAQDNTGTTIFMYALQYRCNDLLQLIAEHPGLQINLKNHMQQTALMLACQVGYHLGVYCILHNSQETVKLNHIDQYKHSALFYASEIGDANIVKLLLSNGARIDLRSQSTNTPVLQALLKGHMDIVRLLVEKGGYVDLNKIISHKRIEPTDKEFIANLVTLGNANSKEPMYALNDKYIQRSRLFSPTPTRQLQCFRDVLTTDHLTKSYAKIDILGRSMSRKEAREHQILKYGYKEIDLFETDLATIYDPKNYDDLIDDELLALFSLQDPLEETQTRW